MFFSWKIFLIGAYQTVGYLIEGCTGFGATVTASAINAMVLGAAVSIPFQCMITLPVQYYSVVKNWKDMALKDLKILLLASIPCVLVGNYVNTILDATKAKIGIGIVVVFIALMNIYRHIIKPLVLKQQEDVDAPDTAVKKAVRILFLIAGAVVHGAFGIGGPLLTVYTLNAVNDKIHFRNTMIGYWAVINTINVVRQGLSGLWTPAVYSAAICALPFTFLGYYLGKKLLYKVNREQFLRIVYVLLLVVGSNMLYQTLK